MHQETRSFYPLLCARVTRIGRCLPRVTSIQMRVHRTVSNLEYKATWQQVKLLYLYTERLINPSAAGDCIFFSGKPRSKFISCTDLLLFKERNKWEEAEHLPLLQRCVKESLV